MDSHLNEAAASSAELHFNETVLSWSLYTSPTSNNMIINGNRSNIRSSGDIINEANEKSVTLEGIKHEIKENENIFQVHTQDANGISRTYLTKKIVIAAGPWAPELYGHEISMSLHAERRVQLWFEPKTNKDLFKVRNVMLLNM